MNLDVIVRKYVSKIRPLAQAELDWFQSQPDLSVVIKYAGLAINCKGKRYSHQRRIKRGVLPQAEKILVTNMNILSQCSNFDELFDLIDTLLKPVGGIGELYVYDTSLRIGAKLKKLPTKVYLHTGTREGAKALGFDGSVKSIEISELPPEFQKLEPYEIEDVLCIFKDKFKQMKFDLSDEEISRRSFCS